MFLKSAVAAGAVLIALVAMGSASAAPKPTLTATLAGVAEVPGPGDPDGDGTATLRIDAAAGELCYTLAVAGITLPAAAAYVHLGAAGVAGGVVVALGAPDAEGKVKGCATGVAAASLEAILADPSSFYVNVHTPDYPAGALRGQLRSGLITFTLVERDSPSDDFGFVDNPPKSKRDPRREEPEVSAGDLFAFSGGLFTAASGGTRAGGLDVDCVATKGAKRFDRARFQCLGTATLENGTLSLSVGGRLGPRVVVAITGGTGIYAGARGTMISKETQRGAHDRFTIFL